MKDLYDPIINIENTGEPLVLTTILSKSGSAPREEGTKMLVKQDFSIIGTIGGGVLEALTIKATAKVFENKEYIIQDFSLSNKDASSIGMVCGGDIKVLFEYINYQDTLLMEVYKKAQELKNNRIDFVMITKLPKESRFITSNEKCLCTKDSTFYWGKSEVKNESTNVIETVLARFSSLNIEEINVNGELYLIEPFFHYESVCIVGAGHVAQPIAVITKMLGFYTVIVDDREEFANKERFPMADEINVIPDYLDLVNHIRVDSNSYIVIVTRGHSYDKEVLAQMLKTDAKYIGMIGSRSKKAYTYDLLKEEGFTEDDLTRVFCPIGLNINADTPEEIAVSIAAELVQVRRKK
jgi:xanthine dehydrogenase accessory factor